MRRLLVILSIGVLQLGGAWASDLQSTDISKSVRECAADRSYAPGGARVGDCLRDRAAKVEARIASALHRTSKQFCNADTKERFWKAQALWRDYRQTSCALIEDSPGNTPSYVTASACHLQLTQQRIEAIEKTGALAFERCLLLSFEPVVSRFGAPPAGAVKLPRTGIAWRATAGGKNIRVSRDGRKIITLDTAGCNYCQGADCSEGVFLFRYLAPLPDNPAFVDYALLHACRAADGVRFQLAADLLTAPKISLRQSGLPSFDWTVDGSSIAIGTADGRMATWKPSE